MPDNILVSFIFFINQPTDLSLTNERSESNNCSIRSDQTSDVSTRGRPDWLAADLSAFLSRCLRIMSTILFSTCFVGAPRVFFMARKRQCDYDEDVQGESLSKTGDDSSDTNDFALL